mmetsp:Transcript_7683/g.17535  ORF Transcript_7683/g.17535 Transcript_7683/m.17535 type:complete len:389 (-) Transcript_7683:291-1457(-)
MKPELRRLPLLEGLEDEGDGAEVGAVELGERLHRLVVILRRRATDEGEAGEVDDGVGDDGAVGEELVDGAGEVETSRVDAHDAAAAGLELLDEGGVVTLVLSVDVRLLQNDADRRRLLGVDADSAGVLLVVPPVVLGGVLEDLRGKGMPDADVGEEDGGSDLLLLHHLSVIDVGVGHVEKHRLEVLGRPTQPVLEGEHEGPRVLRLVRRQELEHLGEGAEKLEHGALERRSVLLPLLLHEFSDDGLRLSHLRHGEGSDLIQTHDVGHGWEDEHSIELLAEGLDDLDDLLRELLHEDERPDEDVRRLHVALERLQRRRVAKLLKEVSHGLNAHVLLSGVDALAGDSHGGLVLRLEDDIDDLELLAPVDVLGHDATIFRVGVSEEASCSS